VPELLKGARALVTGGGRGIGPHIARLLASEGAAIALTYRASRDGADRVVEEIRADGGTAFAFPADLTQEEDCRRLAAEATEALGGLDILINNAAGFGSLKPLAEADWGLIDTEWEAVVKPVVMLTRAVLPTFLAQKHGRIVNLAATVVQRPAVGYGPHAMAKGAVLAYTQTLAREVGPQGITVNAVSPGVTRTEFSETLPEETKAAIIAQTPLRRLALPEDVAKAVVFYCTPLADFVTGANIAPDGGLVVL
jgi:3-oxoacyl-[acyl-carrier protein] reductase